MFYPLYIFYNNNNNNNKINANLTLTLDLQHGNMKLSKILSRLLFVWNSIKNRFTNEVPRAMTTFTKHSISETVQDIMCSFIKHVTL